MNESPQQQETQLDGAVIKPNPIKLEPQSKVGPATARNCDYNEGIKDDPCIT